jgi:glycosyltransferase involved in cell wall biosynthesis
MIASGMRARTWQLQPWRYLHEVACQLAALGHSFTVLSDGRESLPEGMLRSQVKVRQLPSVRNPAWKPNRPLLDEIHQVAPDVVIWHVGLTSLLYQVIPNDLNIPIVGLFSNPIYQPSEIAHFGLVKLVKNYRFTSVHLAGSLAPNWYLRALASKNGISSLVVQTITTQRSLEKACLWSKPIRVIPPGVDEQWSAWDRPNSGAIRRSWGFKQGDHILAYYGSPAEWRGLNTLIEALDVARHFDQNLKLVILSRSRPNEWVREEHKVMNLVHDCHLETEVKFISGFLEPTTLVDYVAATDIITLPFELLPSDAPLGVLEALALGKPVVTTRVACLPELVSKGVGYLAEPGDPNSLSDAIARAVAGKFTEPGKGFPNPEKKPARSWQAMGMEWSHYLQSL